MKIMQTANGWLFWCPGCNKEHRAESLDGPVITLWTANGEPRGCVATIHGETITFDDLCTHDLAGKTVPLEPIP